MSQDSILVINTGSSSLKFGLYAQQNGDERALLDGLADGIGQKNGTLQVKDGNGKTLRSENLSFTSRHEALTHAARWLNELSPEKPRAVGHRVVHGGPRLTKHQPITPAVIAELKACVHFAPLHIPMALQLIAESQQAYPGVPQFACFDTAFHRTLPESEARFAISRGLFDEGIRRYGFHGLSYESIVHQLGAELPQRTVMAHLGSGASLVAVDGGKSVATTMGLTPTGGIPMATRTGDLDPGVLLYLQRVKHMNADQLERLLNHDAGLAALSGGTGDMRSLQAAAGQGDHNAELAIDVFCRAIAKVVAGYVAILGGVDLLIFAGGIGEHSSEVRSRACARLTILGITISAEANRASQPLISDAASKVRVRIVRSEEDRQIARHCRTMLRPSRAEDRG